MRVLILHASAGAGHQRAAEAIAKAIRIENERAEVVLTDILDFTPAIFKRTYAKGYLMLVRRAPELWGYMYARSDRHARVAWRARIRSTFNKINAADFLSFYRDFAPTVAVCTHFLPLELLAATRRRNRLGARLHCAVTDFAVHSLWMVDHVDRYYVASEEARRQLLRRGQPQDGIRVTGIPVDPVFAARVDAREARRRLGLQPDLPTVLILSGGFGVGAMPDVIRAFRGACPRCQLVGVAGASEKTRRQAAALAREASVPVTVFGRVDNMHEFMDAADLVITKPGGLSTSEALAKGRPMLLTEPIPGQEQRNCEHLLESGAALRLYEADDAPEKVRQLLDDANLLPCMTACARALGKPDAAREIARDILQCATA